MTKKRKLDVYYCLMDGRAAYDIDRAAILETCSTYKEAMKSVTDFGGDTCIVKVEGQKWTLEYQRIGDIRR